jgi:hypothetical protein|tara:strand:+ start:845 stop:1024 length:180 start_codon:yes stop_codon:yes gene_type:complete
MSSHSVEAYRTAASGNLPVSKSGQLQPSHPKQQITESEVNGIPFLAYLAFADHPKGLPE